MAKCKIDLIAYLPTRLFVENLLDNKPNSESFQNLVDFLSASGFEFNSEDQADRDTLKTIITSITSNNPAFKSFKSWVIDESYIVKKESQKQITGGQSRSPQHNAVEKTTANLSVAGMRKSQINFDTPSPNRIDVAQNFFGGDSYSFNRYEENLMKRVFQTILVDFTTGTSVRNDEDLNNNLNKFYNRMYDNLKNYLISINKATGNESNDDILKIASDYFKIQFQNGSVSSLENNPAASAAYNDFVTLKVGFDNQLALYGLNIVHIKKNLMNKYDVSDGGKYSLATDAKFSFSYGNDNYNVLDETTNLIKTLVNITNIVKVDDHGKLYVEEGEFLNMNSVLATITKLKTAKSVRNKGIRLSPVEGYRNIMREILYDPSSYIEFGMDDLDNIRSIYNFYYKSGTEADKNIKASTEVDGIYSLVQIYNKDLSVDGVLNTDSNLLINITSHFDKAVAKMYTSLTYDKNTNTWIAKEAKESNANKHYQQNLDVFNNYINVNSKHVYEKTKNLVTDMSKNPIVRIGGFNIEIDSDKLSIDGFTKTDFVNGTKGVFANSEKEKIYNSIVEADKILKLNLFTNSGRLGKLLFTSDNRVNASGLLKLAANVIYLSHVKHRADLMLEAKQVSTLAKGITDNLTENTTDGYFANGKSLTAISPKDTMVESFLINLSALQSMISGDAYKSTITADSGAKFPANALIAVVHDDQTNFAEIQEVLAEQLVAAKDRKSRKIALEKIPVSENIFAQYNTDTKSLSNYNLLAGEVLRTTIMDEEGNTKDAAKMSTVELITQAIFSDFYGNIVQTEGSNKVVAMQLAVYADKVGQMLKKFDLGHIVNYKGTNYDLTKSNKTELAELHYNTVGGQYRLLNKRVSDELRRMFLANYSNDYNVFYNDLIKRFTETHSWMTKGFDITQGLNENSIKPEYLSNKTVNDVKELNKLLADAKIMFDGIKFEYKTFERIIPLYNETELVAMGRIPGVDVDVHHEVHYSGRSKLSLNNELLVQFKNYADDTMTDDQVKRMNTEKNKMLRTMLRQGFFISAFKENYILQRDESGKVLPIEYNPQLKQIEKFINGNGTGKSFDSNFKLDEWINHDTGELVLFKTHTFDANGKIEGVKNGTINDLTAKEGFDPVRQDEFVMNPILEYYFWMHNILTTNYNLAVAGGIHAHELKRLGREDVKGMDDDYNNRVFEEAIISARTTASDKRNVFFQATRHEYMQDVVEGMPLHVKTSTINDTRGLLYNLIGELENFANFDGSALMTAKAMIMGDNSLGQVSTRGFTHKLLHHKYDPRYLTAELEKYAVFGITNEMIRKSKNSKIYAKKLLKKMEDILVSENFNIFDESYNKVDDTNPNSESTLVDIGNGYKMWSYLQGKVLYKKPEDKHITEVLGFKQHISSDGTITYTQKLRELYDNGGFVEFETTTPIRIDTVYSLWEALGGEYSVERYSDGKFKMGTNGNFYYSEASNYNSAEIMNRYRKLKNPNIKAYIQSNYDMPLKNAMIYQLNNTSGIKNGAKNINPVGRWYDEEPLHYYMTNTAHWGIQMNGDHGFDEEDVSTVTEMSQVISAAEANGHYHHIAKQLYKNIAKVVELSMEKYTDKLKDSPKELYLILTRDMMKSMLNADELGFAQSYLKRVEASINDLAKSDSNIKASELMDTVKTAFSDNNMYSAMISMISGAVNRTAIKRKYSGIAAVIRPGKDIYTVMELDGQMYNGEDFVTEDPESIISERITPRDTIDFTRAGVTKRFNFENPGPYYKNPADAYYAFTETPEEFFKKIGLPSAESLTSDNEVKYTRINGLPRNLRGTTVTIDYNGNTIDRLDLDSVRAKFALIKLKDLYKSYTSAKNNYETINKQVDADNKSKLDLKKRKYSSIDLENANAKFIEAKAEYEAFQQSYAYQSLKSLDFVPATDTEIVEDYDKLSLKLFKLIEIDHKLLEENKLVVPAKYKPDGSFERQIVDLYPRNIHLKKAECLLSNINRFRYGIEKGTKISEINKQYFANKLNNKELTNYKYSDFYVQSLKGDDEVHFLNAERYEKLKKAYGGKGLIKAAPDVQTEAVIDDQGEQHVYLIDSNTGNRLFPLDDFLTLDDNGNYVTDIKDVVVEIDGKMVVVYNDIHEVEGLIKDRNFHCGLFRYNFNSNDVKYQKEYLNKIDKRNSEVREILKLSKSNDRINAYKNILREVNDFEATKLYASWMKQLEVIAARIPAQSLQSFMAMEVVGFVDDDINAVILPTMKNWLDGSDFDIDKTYMMGFGVDENGFLYKFNDFFNEVNPEESYLKLPVPEGKPVDFRLSADSKLTADKIMNAIKYVQATDKMQRTTLNENQNGVAHLFEDFAEVLTDMYESENGKVYIHLPKTVKFPDVENGGMKELPITSIKDLSDLRDAFNDYHKTRPKHGTILETTKNSVAQALITISSSIGNLPAGERPISMDQTRDAAKLTDKAQAARELSREDPLSIYLQIIQQNAGKAVVGISAVGEKVFFAYSYHINESLRKEEERINKGYKTDAEKIAVAKESIKKLAGNTRIRKKNGNIIIPNLIANANFDGLTIMSMAYDEYLKEAVAVYTTPQPLNITKVISGAQTGVDQIGLNVAWRKGIATGGTAPVGYKTEEGDKFKLFNNNDLSRLGVQPITASAENDYWSRNSSKDRNEYTARTAENAKNSDATIYFNFGDSDSAGYKETKRACEDAGKLFIDASKFTKEQLTRYLAENKVETLNIAGNRGSTMIDEDHDLVTETLTYIFNQNKTMIPPPSDADKRVEIIDVRDIDDASLVISEVLSAATDNAKELILDKINAGPELAGVYMYMIMQGVPFQDIARIMISPVVNKVVAKSKQNWFDKANKGNNIDTAVSYYLDGVNAYDYFGDYKMVGEFAKRVSNTMEDKKDKWDTKAMNAMTYLSGVFNNITPEKIEEIRSKISMDPYDSSIMHEGEVIKRQDVYEIKFMINRFLNENLKRINDIGTDRDEFIAELQNFAKIKEESEELTIFGRRLGINQGIKTTLYDAYNYDYSMNNWLFKKFKAFDGNRLQQILRSLYVSRQGLSDFSLFYDIKRIHQLSDHDKRIISDMYNEVKYSMNILEAELNLPHFASMIQAGYNTQDVFAATSSRFEIHRTLAEWLTKGGYIKASNSGFYHKFDEKEFKTISNYIINKYIDKFFAENDQFKFLMPDGSKIITEENGKYVKTTANLNNNNSTQSSDGTRMLEFDLTTPENRATFKLFFESEFVPSLQEKYPDNKFIQSLIVDKKRNAINGTEYFYVKSNFNMSSITDKKNVNSNAEIIFNGLVAGFEDLNAATEFGNNVWEMFALYNILINKNSFGASTFTKLIQSSTYMNDDSSPFQQFMEYQGSRDFYKDFKINDAMVDELALRLATVETYAKEGLNNSKYLKIYNVSKGRYDIVKYIDGKPEVTSLKNSENNIDAFMIDDFISDTVIDKLLADKHDVAEAIFSLNNSIDNGSVIQLIKCD